MAKADYCCCDDCDCKVVYAPDHDYEFSGPIGVFCAECHKARGDAYEKLKAENRDLRALQHGLEAEVERFKSLLDISRDLECKCWGQP